MISALEVEPGDAGQVLQMRQSGIGDPSSAEEKDGEVGQPLQMYEPASATAVSSR